ncbi:MAG TPA: cytochrome c [Allosphingosinicella sp.]
MVRHSEAKQVAGKGSRTRIPSLLLLLAAAAALIVAVWPKAEVRSELLPAGTEALSAGQLGAQYFYGEDFGGLSRHTLDSHAVPWRLTAAALVLTARDANPRIAADGATLNRILAGFGFLFPSEIANWPAGTARPGTTLPLGMTYGRLGLAPGLGVTVANLGCASCHSGPAYDSAGRPRLGRAWLGMPNSSLDLEAYTGALYHALRATAGRPAELMATVDALFPEIGAAERFALRRLVLPRVRARLKELEPLGRASPFPNGSPGNTNGVAALKHGLGLPLVGGGKGETGITSIPDLGHRTWRTSLLYDGSYAVPGRPRTAPMREKDVTPAHLASLAAIMTFFTVPSMGVAPERALAGGERAEAVMAFLHRYRPQPFPGPVDAAAARRGQAVYGRHCAACHGTYDGHTERPRLVSFPNWIGDPGTDPDRRRVFNSALVAAVAAGPYRDRIAAWATGRYAAPPLTGLWASAPYLHNGSVPTIAALLEPASRPQRFLVGGHALDFERLGIAIVAGGGYPAGYRPWSRPAWTDVRAAGRSNAGHLHGAGLRPEERSALIEFLKLL